MIVSICKNLGHLSPGKKPLLFKSLLTSQCLNNNKTFLHVTQKHFSTFSYQKKCGESMNLLVHFVFFTLFYIIFNGKISVSNTENHQFLFITCFCDRRIKFIFAFALPSLHTYCIPQSLILKCYTQACRQPFQRRTYEPNLFNKNFNNFNKFLTIVKCSVELDFKFNVTVDSYC